MKSIPQSGLTMNYCTLKKTDVCVIDNEEIACVIIIDIVYPGDTGVVDK